MRNERTYIAESLPEFLEHLPVRIEEFLQRIAVREFVQAIERQKAEIQDYQEAGGECDDTITVDFGPIAQVLEREARNHGLPVDPAMIDRAVRFANDRAGFRENIT